MIKSLIIILALVSVVITKAVYDPNFPDLGLDATGTPRYGPITILTGLAYPDGIHFGAPYVYTYTIKQCADHVIKNVHKGMASWNRRTKRCTLIYSDKTVEGDKNRGTAQIFMRVSVVDGGIADFNAPIEYFPKGQTSWTVEDEKIEGEERFDEFQDKCHVALNSWVTVNNVPQWGWSCLNYVQDRQSALLFVTQKDF